MPEETVAPAAIAAALLALADERAPGRTACPSEAARRLAGDDGDWRVLMPAVHEAAVALAASGDIELTAKGRVLPAARPKGAYRIRRPR